MTMDRGGNNLPEEWRQQLEALERDGRFLAAIDEFSTVFYERGAKRQVILGIRALAQEWVADAADVAEHGAAFLDLAVSAAVARALPRAVRPAAAETIAPKAPTRQRRKAIIDTFPQPIASCFGRAVSGEAEPVARYGAMLDTFENLLIFLTHVQVSQYLFGDLSDPDLDLTLVAMLVQKPNLSVGDWSKLVAACTKVFRGSESELFYPELPDYLFDATGRPSASAQVLHGLCAIRNRHWGHSLSRSAEVFEQRLPGDLSLLEGELNRMSFLSDTLLVVPTRIEGGSVVEGRVYAGSSEPLIDSLNIPLLPRDLAEADGLVRPNSSLLLYREEGGYRCLYPFFRYRDTADRQRRGLCFLTDTEWIVQEHHKRLKKVRYVAQRGAAGPEHDAEAAAAVECVLRKVLARVEESSKDLALVRGIAHEDRDYSFPSVWTERDERLRTCVGRESQLRNVRRELDGIRRTGALVVIRGEPGIGKSSFMVKLHDQLADMNPLLHLVHCGRSPKAFLKVLIHQCGRVLGRPLGEASYDYDTVEELRGSLERRMQEVARERGGCCVAVVDGLDELGTAPADWAGLLEWLPEVYPPGIAFVVTCRQESGLLHAIGARVSKPTRRDLDLGPLLPADLDEFVRRHVPDTSPALLREVIDLESVFARIEGHPLFFRNVLNEAATELREAQAENRTARRLPASSIPTDAASQMERIWDQATRGPSTESREEKRLRRRVLEYLCCASFPGLSLGLLRSLLERTSGQVLDLEDVAGHVLHISAFLKEPVPGRYLPFHSTLRDYVTLRKIGEEDCRRRHEEIARLLIERPSTDVAYWTQAVTDHGLLAELPSADQVHVACDKSLIKARLRGGMGALHGAWLAQVQDDEGALATGFLEAWGTRSELFSGLDVLLREELVDLLEAAKLPGFSREAKRICEELYDVTQDPRFLLRKARLCYQDLDEWREARDTLEQCAEAFNQAERVLEAACATRVLAEILFDCGDDESDPEDILRTRCLPVFDRLQDRRELAMTWETLGIVIDAQARWTESRTYYERARGIYHEVHDRCGLARVSHNAAIARLFTEGPTAASDEFATTRSLLPKSGETQLRQYLLANTCMLALLRDDRTMFLEADAAFKSEEKWIMMSVDESRAVQRWFSGGTEDALTRFEALARDFDSLDDAWGHTDNFVNAGLLLTHMGSHERAVPYLLEAHATSLALRYQVGAAMAGEGLRRAGRGDATRPEDVTFFDRYLAHLFAHCPSPFMPCYVLLLP